MRIYLATSNANKVSELTVMFYGAHLAIEVNSAKDVGGMPQVEENGETFLENARLKAVALKQKIPYGAWVLAEDSGLEVDILNGEPGVRSARYAGAEASDEDRWRKLLTALESYPADKRSARFVCCMVLLEPSGGEEVFSDACEGVIAREPVGESGFGYDPVFIPEGFEQTLAELGSAKKDRLSHRARALQQMVHWFLFHQTAFGAAV